jgi:hypothetical protein
MTCRTTAAAAAAGDERYKDAAYQLWHLLDASSEGKWEGLVNTWWNVTDGSWLPGELSCCSVLNARGQMHEGARFLRLLPWLLLCSSPGWRTTRHDCGTCK